MTDLATQARTARENLAKGLAVLQSPGVPPRVMDVAEPVAQAMGSLHRIEADPAGVSQHAPTALDFVRRALAMLQGAAGQHPAVDQAMEAVASSLGLIHGLSQLRPAAAAPATAGAAFAQSPAMAGLGSTVVMQPGGSAPAAPQAAAQAWPQPAAAPAPMPAPAPAPAYGAPAQPYAPPPGGGYGAPPPPAPAWGPAQPPPGSWPNNPAPQAAAPQPAWPQAPVPAPAAAPAPAPAAAPGAAPSTINAPPNVPRVEAALGAHSPSNFYKGLSGNDVIDSGGIFVATYQIPKIGTNVLVKVSLPGGYEFEALGVVEWTREAPNSISGGIEAPPGFGAKLTQVTPEGRQLVYRYVRNREPLFHDDL